jgi:hypothetical protein
MRVVPCAQMAGVPTETAGLSESQPEKLSLEAAACRGSTMRVWKDVSGAHARPSPPVSNNGPPGSGPELVLSPAATQGLG